MKLPLTPVEPVRIMLAIVALVVLAALAGCAQQHQPGGLESDRWRQGLSPEQRAACEAEEGCTIYTRKGLMLLMYRAHEAGQQTCGRAL